MVSLLASSAEGLEFDSHPGQTKDIKNGICCSSAKHAEYRKNIKDMSVQSLNYVFG